MNSQSLGLTTYAQTKEVAPGVIGAYQPFGHQVTFLPKEGWESLKSGDYASLPPWIVEDLHQRGFLVAEGQDAASLKAADRGPEGLGELWLVVVQSCNMSCQYCVVEGNVENEDRRKFTKSKSKDVFDNPLIVPDENGDPILNVSGGKSAPDDEMTPEIAVAGVEMFERLLQTVGQPRPRVTFYGGEPMLNRAAMKAAIPRIAQIRWPAQAKPTGVDMLMITNGQIYDEEMTRLFKQHNVMVSVSLDGMKHHHDAVRVNHGGGGTWDKATQSLERYSAAGINTGICTTIGTHNVEDLPEIADYFAERFGVPVEFQVPFDIGCGGNEYYLKMVDAFDKSMEAYERLRRRGMLEGLAFKRVAEMAAGGFRRSDCSAIGSQITVAPDGKLGPCHSLVGERIGFVGNALDRSFNPFDTDVFQEWARRYPANMEDCHGCPAIAICGGGCPYNALIQRGSIWKKDPQQCSYMDAFVNWFIDDCWKRYQAGIANAPMIGGHGVAGTQGMPAMQGA
jgi:uncharacterized protein